ncbi:MAG: metal-dependent hydrolase [Verrucomicrobiales bacterium]|nr:metal-dependent hydrolase [Verrucomicrobiales bacterium]
MAPLTHLLASWVVAVHTTDNPRDTRLVALAGIAPDLDGVGLLVDLTNQALGRPETDYYHLYHHWYGHGLLAALIASVLLAAFAKQRLRVFALSFAMFHLHLLCDLAGSRGPGLKDLWPIYYFGPFRYRPMWVWPHQWPLESWPNQLITLVLFAWSISIALNRGRSIMEVFNRRADTVFVNLLRKWQNQIACAARR